MGDSTEGASRSGRRGWADILDFACDRYRISVQEFTSWQRAIKRRGIGALRVTRLKEYRQLF